MSSTKEILLINEPAHKMHVLMIIIFLIYLNVENSVMSMEFFKYE